MRHFIGSTDCLSQRYESQGHGGKYVQLWVMMEYDVRESWTKLFKFEILNDHDPLRIPIFYTERMIVMCGYDKYGMMDELRRFDHKEEDKLDKVAVCTGRYRLEWGCRHMIEYDESLLWLSDSRAEGGKNTQNPTQAQKRK
ncbi:hypothetical protein M0R45_004809 [Rubus argutus]|uniref:F-box associated domain-containing protein n=1 Tax=Rubus argutus TaxID=59490 RepID=A0AAW1YL14_RUBAR